MLLFSDDEEDNTPNIQGMALVLSKTAQRALIGWEAHRPCIIIASFRTKTRRLNMNISQCNARPIAAMKKDHCRDMSRKRPQHRHGRPGCQGGQQQQPGLRGGHGAFFQHEMLHKMVYI